MCQVCGGCAGDAEEVFVAIVDDILAEKPARKKPRGRPQQKNGRYGRKRPPFDVVNGQSLGVLEQVLERKTFDAVETTPTTEGGRLYRITNGGVLVMAVRLTTADQLEAWGSAVAHMIESARTR